MPAYITIDRFKQLATIPSEFVADVEAREPGFVDAQLVYWSDWIDAQLCKRYATPFVVPIPIVVEGWLARIVNMRVWSKRGVDPSDEQWSESKADDKDARAEIERAANSETGLYELPLRADKPESSGVVHAFPRAYSEASPYVWTDRQYQRGSQEDESGNGSHY